MLFHFLEPAELDGCFLGSTLEKPELSSFPPACQEYPGPLLFSFTLPAVFLEVSFPRLTLQCKGHWTLAASTHRLTGPRVDDGSQSRASPPTPIPRKNRWSAQGRNSNESPLQRQGLPKRSPPVLVIAFLLETPRVIPAFV